MFKYYEDGNTKKISFRKAYRMFTTLVDENQKAQGTTFTSRLEKLLPQCMAEVRKRMIKRLIRMKSFSRARLLGKYWRIIMDGTGLFYFKEKHCENCLVTTLAREEEGKGIKVKRTQPKTCSVCGETEGDALDHEWMEATYDAPKTCSLCALTEGEPLPEPYFSEYGIVCEELKDFDKPIDMSIVENGELVEKDDTWLEYDKAYYTFGEIMSEPAEEEGYITVTIPYDINIPYDWCIDSSFSRSAEWRYSIPIIDVCDYYTGIKVRLGSLPANGSTEGYQVYEWEGNTYSMTVMMSREKDSRYYDWISEGNIEREPHKDSYSCVISITMPEDYDGAVLFCSNKGDLRSTSTQTGESDSRNRYVCDENKPEDYTFFRLSDYVQ